MPWTDDDLARLRTRYAGEEPFADPRHARAASLFLGSAGRRPMPYAGLPTLLDAPARPDGDAAGLNVALYGMPVDLAVTNRPGARFGPRALRAQERVGPYHDTLNLAPLHEMAVADIGDVPFRSRYDLAASHADIEAFVGRIVAAGALPLGVGGDHSVTHPVLRAVGRDRPVGLIHIDAHCDTSGAQEGERFHHGGPFRNAVLDGVLDPTRTVQIGIRGSAEWLWGFSHDSGMTVIRADDLAARGVASVIETMRDVIGEGPVYVSFDIDSLDPAHAPGTGTPEIGGLTTREALALLRGAAGLDVVGGDVVEVAPAYDATSNTAHAGAQMLFEILGLMAVRRSSTSR